MAEAETVNTTVAPSTATAPVPPAPSTSQPSTQSGGHPTQPVNPGLDSNLTKVLRGEANFSTPKETPQEPLSTKQEQPETPTGGLNDLKPEDIDDPQLKSLGNLLVGAVPNLDIQRALGNAIEYLDPELIDSRYIQEVAGDRAQAVQDLATQIVQVASAQSYSTLNSIHESAGGEANWNASVAAFNKDAPKEMREVVAAMLDSKNFGKIKTGAKFILDFAKQSGNIGETPQYQATSAFRGDASEALSKADFQKALRSLKPEHSNPDWARERQDLIRKRTLGKQLGL